MEVGLVAGSNLVGQKIDVAPRRTGRDIWKEEGVMRTTPVAAAVVVDATAAVVVNTTAAVVTDGSAAEGGNVTAIVAVLGVTVARDN